MGFLFFAFFERSERGKIYCRQVIIIYSVRSLLKAQMAFMPRKPLDNEKNGMLGSQARHQPYYEAFTSCSDWVVLVDANCMPLEARCQEDKGRNLGDDSYGEFFEVLDKRNAIIFV